nr:hypothetical protein GCM10025730_31890 [Promicromonospora thailandica]
MHVQEVDAGVGHRLGRLRLPGGLGVTHGAGQAQPPAELGELLPQARDLRVAGTHGVTAARLRRLGDGGPEPPHEGRHHLRLVLVGGQGEGAALEPRQHVGLPVLTDRGSRLGRRPAVRVGSRVGVRGVARHLTDGNRRCAHSAG